MEQKELTEIIKYFEEYKCCENGKYYFHKECDDFHIVITPNNEIYQLNTDHELYGIELKTLENLQNRFKSFTGERWIF